MILWFIFYFHLLSICTRCKMEVIKSAVNEQQAASIFEPCLVCQCRFILKALSQPWVSLLEMASFILVSKNEVKSEQRLLKNGAWRP